MNINTRLQNLRDFTVQICHPVTGTLIGAGIVVSLDGKIVTSSLVLYAVGISAQSSVDREGAQAAVLADSSVSTPPEVGVFFPQALPGLPRHRRAIVVAGGDALVASGLLLLQLLDGPAPLAPEQVAVPGTPERSVNHAFRSFCYDYTQQPVFVSGSILSMTDATSRPNAPAAKGITLQVDTGLRCVYGAAVLDVSRNLVVGVLSAPPASLEQLQDQMSGADEAFAAYLLAFPFAADGNGSAWASSIRPLSRDPFDVHVYDMSMRKRAGYYPRHNRNAVHAMAAPRAGRVLYGAPDVVTKWAGRDEVQQQLFRDWQAGPIARW